MNSIHHPIFLECLTKTDDPNMVKILEDLSMDISSLFTFVDNAIVHNKTNKVINYKMLDSNKLFEEIQDVLSNDVENIDCWSLIKKKDYKDLLIERFILKMQKIHDLSIRECKKLYLYIQEGLYSKSIEPDDIVMFDGDIQAIFGISFENKTVFLPD